MGQFLLQNSFKLANLLQSALMAAGEDSPIDLEKSDSLTSFFARIFKADFMPHGHCFFWRGELVWLHVLSDALIAASYFSIPLMLLRFRNNRKDLPYPWMFVLFAAFIFWCGTTHLMSILTLWVPVYRAEGIIKLVTALISLATAILLFPIIPQALSLRSPQELEEKNTELKKAYQALLEERARANEEEVKRQELEKFAHLASHDLKEPLRTISLFSDLLKIKLGPDLDGEIKEYLSYIIRNSNRMGSLIDDLVSYSKLDIKDTHYETIPLKDCLKLSLENLDLAIEESGAVIQVDWPKEDEMYVKVIPSQITQLLQNLIANAIKFSIANQVPQIKIGASVEGNQWVISVSDKGIGFDEQFKENIFLVFKRLHANEEIYPGTGMGLAICKKIIEQHGGKIWARSLPGRGATFYFSLPKA